MLINKIINEPIPFNIPKKVTRQLIYKEQWKIDPLSNSIHSGSVCLKLRGRRKKNKKARKIWFGRIIPGRI